jgi:hypothetical protein
MIAAEIIGQVLDAGGQIEMDGADLVLTAPRPLPADLLDRLRTHKPDILAALAHPLPPLSAAAYELVGYFEERLAAVQRYAPTELHMNSRPPTVAPVRDAVRATLALPRRAALHSARSSRRWKGIPRRRGSSWRSSDGPRRPKAPSPRPA